MLGSMVEDDETFYHESALIFTNVAWCFDLRCWTAEGAE